MPTAISKCSSKRGASQVLEVNDKDGFFVATVRVGKSQFELTPAVEA